MTRLSHQHVSRARRLRNSAADGEKKFWAALRQFKKLYGFHVRRQAPIGPYIADFAIHGQRLIIEVDGEHHHTNKGLARDVQRDAWFEKAGYKTLRFSTGDLDDIDGCVNTLLHRLGVSR